MSKRKCQSHEWMTCRLERRGVVLLLKRGCYQLYYCPLCDRIGKTTSLYYEIRAQDTRWAEEALELWRRVQKMDQEASDE